MNNVKTGAVGEDLARRYLERNGYEILDTNIKFSRVCELDIIAKIKKTIVFVEVKTRKTDAFGTPAEAITPAKYQNIEEHPMHSYFLNPVQHKLPLFQFFHCHRSISLCCMCLNQCLMCNQNFHQFLHQSEDSTAYCPNLSMQSFQNHHT